MSIIEVNNVTKEFKLGQLKSVKDTIQRSLGRLVGKKIEPLKPFKALEDVDFKVETGEVLGIVGQNGAGKSTLLKILSRICVPTKGSVIVKGKVAPLIEVGAGLHPELTGRENIFLNGAIMGIPRSEIVRKFDEIVEFSELSDFIDTPIKRYSSGMAVRLGFTIATSIDADILIVDEVLGVGDLAFQRKCFERMDDLIKRRGSTVLFVSHNIRQIERLCTRTILLDNGKIIEDGAPNKVCNMFYERNDAKIKANAVMNNTRTIISDVVEYVSVEMYDKDNNKVDTIQCGDKVIFKLNIKINADLIKPVIYFGLHTTDLVYLATDNSADQLHVDELPPGTYEVLCNYDKLPFLPGVYSARVRMWGGEMTNTVFYGESLFSFQIIGKTGLRLEGFVDMCATWSAISPIPDGA